MTVGHGLRIRSLVLWFSVLIILFGIGMQVLMSRENDVEDSAYSKITAKNGVVMHILRTEPDRISLLHIQDNVVKSGQNGINGGFFWREHLLSIAVMDGVPVAGKPNAYGSGWFNAKYARGTIVYDRVERELSVQRSSSVDDLQVTDRNQYWAQGGVSMSLQDDSGWKDTALINEALPFPDDQRLRSAMAYDLEGRLYLIVTSSKCTAEQFRSAIQKEVASGELEEAIFLDGDGSSQLHYNEVQLEGDGREVVQMIGMMDEGQ